MSLKRAEYNEGQGRAEMRIKWNKSQVSLSDSQDDFAGLIGSI